VDFWQKIIFWVKIRKISILTNNSIFASFLRVWGYFIEFFPKFMWIEISVFQKSPFLSNSVFLLPTWIIGQRSNFSGNSNFVIHSQNTGNVPLCNKGFVPNLNFIDQTYEKFRNLGNNDYRIYPGGPGKWKKCFTIILVKCKFLWTLLFYG